MGDRERKWSEKNYRSSFFFLLPTDVLIDVYLFRYVEKAFEDSSLKMSIFKFMKILFRKKKRWKKTRRKK